MSESTREVPVEIWDDFWAPLAPALSEEDYCVDLEALDLLLTHAPGPKQIKLVVWVLGRSPSSDVVQASATVLEKMAARTGGRTALLILLTHQKTDDEELQEEYCNSVTRWERLSQRYLEFLAMFAKLLKSQREANNEDRGDRTDEDGLSSEELLIYSGQLLEEKGMNGAMIYREIRARPRLLLLHLLSWEEVLAKAMLEEVARSERSRKETSPMTESIRIVLVERYNMPDRLVKRIFEGVVKMDNYRPTAEQLRKLQERFFVQAKTWYEYKIKTFMCDLFYSSIVESKQNQEQSSGNYSCSLS